MQLDSDPPSQKRSGEPASADEAKGHKGSAREGQPAASAAQAARAEARGAEQKPGQEAPQDAAGAAPPFALMGYFTTPKDIYHACEALRDAGYSRFDAHTPFPVHGLEKAMGLKPSRLPWLVLGGGTTGLISGILLAWYTQAFDYPLIISGKESFSYQAFVPVIFELTVLFSALTCFFGLFAISRLPAFFHPTMTHPQFPRATDDAFFVSVEASDPKFDRAETRHLLQRLGAQGITEVSS
ncbi:hypothetical protein SOCEGT47_067500 [Sorangium cellulosum]|uniref:DUF3341 domain-containing protein n=1 Tax=Sorangium cellulosum TaxID=56 RepID=A0A4P2Q9H7_SORCE|nr:DUF3341 domain-containing protein [Sorangium cellulosum]AUX26189.1 hypothetical protein SOCEGT47_067500 [Sorangium cellulosum]